MAGKEQQVVKGLDLKSSIEGTAYKADPKSDEAKLKVKFIISPLVPIPVVGDYWVLYVDADYQVAIVGNANRTSLWILSRKSHLDEKIYNDLVEKAKEQGYDVSKLTRLHRVTLHLKEVC
ncbi:hypothetical protein Lal_00040500 [Lupinus albus]|nr:hypothetical protein Lal_00040500 [Lupinus albus]